jgi:hypothetical protein
MGWCPVILTQRRFPPGEGLSFAIATHLLAKQGHSLGLYRVARGRRGFTQFNILVYTLKVLIASLKSEGDGNIFFRRLARASVRQLENGPTMAGVA